MYSAEAIANWFLCNTDREAGESITHLKLHKLLYYAQAWYMVLSKSGDPLFNGRIEAWTRGPVVKELYSKYSEYGYENIPAPSIERCEFQVDEEASEILREVLRVYGKFDAKFLEELTRQEYPWRYTREDLPIEVRCDREIPLGIMKDFYEEMNQNNGLHYFH